MLANMPLVILVKSRIDVIAIRRHNAKLIVEEFNDEQPLEI